MSTHKLWREGLLARQKEIDATIAAKADFEFLYDKPYEDNKKVRVAGPFTVESISPYRVLSVDEDDEIIDPAIERESGESRDFAAMIIENLKSSGIQQAHKEDKINFTSIEPFPSGNMICAVSNYMEGEEGKRAAIFIGPEFGTVMPANFYIEWAVFQLCATSSAMESHFCGTSWNFCAI